MDKVKSVISLFVDTFKKWNEDRAIRMAAALSYYGLFSVAPLVFILTADYRRPCRKINWPGSIRQMTWYSFWRGSLARISPRTSLTWPRVWVEGGHSIHADFPLLR